MKVKQVIMVYADIMASTQQIVDTTKEANRDVATTGNQVNIAIPAAQSHRNPPPHHGRGTEIQTQASDSTDKCLLQSLWKLCRRMMEDQ